MMNELDIVKTRWTLHIRDNTLSEGCEITVVNGYDKLKFLLDLLEEKFNGDFSIKPEYLISFERNSEVHQIREKSDLADSKFLDKWNDFKYPTIGDFVITVRFYTISNKEEKEYIEVKNEPPNLFLIKENAMKAKDEINKAFQPKPLRIDNNSNPFDSGIDWELD